MATRPRTSSSPTSVIGAGGEYIYGRLTEDLCEGTLIRVTRDKVAVTNLVNHKHIEVKTGHRYLAKAP